MDFDITDWNYKNTSRTSTLKGVNYVLYGNNQYVKSGKITEGHNGETDIYNSITLIDEFIDDNLHSDIKNALENKSPIEWKRVSKNQYGLYQ